jgi:hypothetical protein
VNARRGVDLAPTAPLRLASPWSAAGDDHSTESRLAAIGRVIPDEAEFLSRVADELDPPGARRRRIERRNAAIVEAAGLLRKVSMSGTAKAVDDELRKFLANVWPRQRNLITPPAELTAVRAALWQIARETDGDGLGWRRILEILET